MLNKAVSIGVLVCAAMLASAQPARAQQTLNFTLGYFAPLGADARVSGDVLIENRDFLLFDIPDFNGASVGGEWLVPLGRHVEGGIGISYSRRTVPTIYERFVDDAGAEIEQSLRLRLVPAAFTIRLLPLGQRSPVQPYFGAGLGIVNWRYVEDGDFIDFGAGNEVFTDTFVSNGSETGPIALGGIRFASRTASAGFEVRYQKANANLGNEFTAPKIDLGGWTYNVTLGVRF